MLLGSTFAVAENLNCHFPASLNYRPFVPARLSGGTRRTLTRLCASVCVCVLGVTETKTVTESFPKIAGVCDCVCVWGCLLFAALPFVCGQVPCSCSAATQPCSPPPACLLSALTCLTTPPPAAHSGASRVKWKELPTITSVMECALRAWWTTSRVAALPHFACACRRCCCCCCCCFHLLLLLLLFTGLLFVQIYGSKDCRPTSDNERAHAGMGRVDRDAAGAGAARTALFAAIKNLHKYTQREHRQINFGL